MIYFDLFQLNRRPFDIEQDPDFHVWSEDNQKTFDAVRDAVLSGQACSMVVGPSGVGKTTLIEALRKDAKFAQKFSTCLLEEPQGDADSVQGELIEAFNGDKNTSDPWAALQIGIDATRDQGRSPIVIVDDAHLMSIDAVKILGRLCTDDDGQSQPVCVVLVSQPALIDRMNLPDFHLLRSGLKLSASLKPLPQAEIAPYITSRLATAGAPDAGDIFESDTIPLIHKSTKGLPRSINRLCEMCLFLAGETGSKTISTASLNTVLANFTDPDADALPENLADEVEVVTLQEPARPTAAVRPHMARGQDIPLSVPVPSPDSKPKPRTIVEAPSGGKKWPLVAGLGVLAGVGYLVSPVGPLPKDNGLMVALYGAPGSAEPVTDPASETQIVENTPATRTPEASVQTSDAPAQTAIVTPPEPKSEPAPEPVILATLTYVEDPKAAERAATHFAAALGAPDPRQSALSYARAAIRGHERSATYLGQLFDTGDGITFAPDVAARWYAVAQDLALLRGVNAQLQLGGGQATPLLSSASTGVAEFIWQGNAEVFQLEIGDKDGAAIAQLKTGLTAVMVELPQSAAMWRVRTEVDTAPAWAEISTVPAQ